MKHIDRMLFITVALLVVGGFLIFSSASLGLLARDGAPLSSVAFNQFLFGIVGGSIALFLASNIHYRIWRKYAFYILIAASILTLLVFVPGLGLDHGGARRWIVIGPFSFQPAEALKLAFVVYLATWLSGMQKYVPSLTRGTIPFILMVAYVGALLLVQPDTDTFAILAAAAFAMFITAGGSWRDVFVMTCIGIVLVAVLAFTRPYIRDRIETFFNPSLDRQGKSYQVTQSLIAVGSGGVWGRGFGQSVQKFEYLPEPTSDSIFAVYAEEFGFVGAVLLVLLFAGFGIRGYRLAAEASDPFGMLLVVGIITLIVAQAFLNMAAMVGLVPLSGLPLPFISHGGTALLVMLGSIGIVLNVSKYRKKTKSA